MAKKLIKMTEQDLHKMICESVKRFLKEGTGDTYLNQKWEEVKEMIGSDAMLDSIYKYLDDIQIREIIDGWVQDGYIDDDDEEEYVEDDIPMSYNDF